MRIAVTEIVEKWGLSKATIYRAIQLGKLDKGDDGLIDIANVVMLWGEPSAKRIKRKSNNQSKTVKIDNDTNEKEKLLLSQIKQLEQQVQQANEREIWFKAQIEKAQEQVRLLEFKGEQKESVETPLVKPEQEIAIHKPSQITPPPLPKNGLFNKLVKAITG